MSFLADNKYLRTMYGPAGGAFLPNEALDARVVPLDQGTADEIGVKSNQASQTDQEVANQSMEHVGGGAGFLSQPDQMSHQAYSLGMTDDGALNQAIQSKYKKYYDSSLNDLKRQAQAKAPMSKSNNMAGAQSVLSGYQDVANQIEQRQYQSEQNKIALKNQVMGNLFGAAGAIVGGIFGGPAGAAAGNKAGSAVAPKANYEGVGDFNAGDAKNYA